MSRNLEIARKYARIYYWRNRETVLVMKKFDVSIDEAQMLIASGVADSWLLQIRQRRLRKLKGLTRKTSINRKVLKHLTKQNGGPNETVEDS